MMCLFIEQGFRSRPLSCSSYIAFAVATLTHSINCLKCIQLDYVQLVHLRPVDVLIVQNKSKWPRWQLFVESPLIAFHSLSVHSTCSQKIDDCFYVFDTLVFGV